MPLLLVSKETTVHAHVDTALECLLDLIRTIREEVVANVKRESKLNDKGHEVIQFMILRNARNKNTKVKLLKRVCNFF